MLNSDNIIYRRQLAVLTFFSIIAFKIVMLPRYLAYGVQRDFVIGMSFALLIEGLAFCVVYCLINNTKLSYMYGNIWIIRLVMTGIIISSSVKFLVLSVETLDYISTLLFQEGRWLFIILTLLPALGYMAYKGGNTIARLGEIVIWAVIIAFIFSLLFLEADIEVNNLIPVFDDGIGQITSTYMKHSLWFGDFTPFFVLLVRESKSKIDRVANPIGIASTYFITLGFYMLFIAIYGDVAPYIRYAFSNIGIYNSISNLLGGVDFPIVCVWMLMAIVKLALLLYSITFSLEHIIKREGNKKLRSIIVLVVTLSFMLILSFAISGTKEIYVFSQSYIRYIVLALDYLILFGLLIRHIYLKIKYKNIRI